MKMLKVMCRPTPATLCLSAANHSHTTRVNRTPCIVCQRQLSQAFYDQFLSPSCPPIGAAQYLMESVHLHSGLPWWASLAVTTVALRTVLTLPLMAYSFNNAAKLELLQSEIKSIASRLKEEVTAAQSQYGWSASAAKWQFKVNMKRLVRQRFERDNCHPAKEYILPWIQIPTWISMSLALRNMAGVISLSDNQLPVSCPDLATEGTLWFSNLLLPDSTLMLPLTACVLNLLLIEMHSLRMQKPTKFQRWLTYTMRCFTLLIIPIGSSVPSCMCLYWVCSSLYGLGQNLLLRIPKVRRALHITRAPSESEKPFRDLWQTACKKYSFQSSTTVSNKK